MGSTLPGGCIRCRFARAPRFIKKNFIDYYIKGVSLLESTSRRVWLFNYQRINSENMGLQEATWRY